MHAQNSSFMVKFSSRLFQTFLFMHISLIVVTTKKSKNETIVMQTIYHRWQHEDIMETSKHFRNVFPSYIFNYTQMGGYFFFTSLLLSVGRMMMWCCMAADDPFGGIGSSKRHTSTSQRTIRFIFGFKSFCVLYLFAYISQGRNGLTSLNDYWKEIN